MDTDVATHLEACRRCQEVVDGLQSQERLTLFKNSDMGLPIARIATTLDFLRRIEQQRPLDPVESTLPKITNIETQGLLGRGGMGVVYLVRQTSLGRLAALKTIRVDREANEEFLARFHREAKAIASLNHENVVKAYDFGEQDGVPFLLMEYVPGGTLHDFLRKTELTARQAAELVTVLACAVDYAHSRGIIHRDLKPGNVLLTPDGTPKITDFGLARLNSFDAQQTAGGRLGTPCYMAPEQARGDRNIGPAADIYALGAILYELLCRRPPFVADDPLEILSQVQSSDPLSPRLLAPRMPRDLETICLKCLNKSPAARYPTALALAEDLQAFLEGRPITARRPGRVERTLKYARRHKLRVFSLAMVVLLLGMGVFAGLQQQKMARTQNAMRLANAASFRVQGTAVASDGDWKGAIQDLTQALAYDHPQPGEVHLELAWIHSNLDDRRRSVEHLEQAEKLLGDTGPVMLARADNLRWTDRTESQRLVKLALKRGALNAAEKSFAEALIATTYNDALLHLRAAVQLRPNDLRSGRMLCNLLLLGGRFDEANRHAEILRALFPKDRSLAQLQALQHAALGDRAKALESLAPLEGQVPPDVLHGMRAAIELVADVPELGSQDLPSVWQLGALVGRFTQISPASIDAMEMPPGLRDAYGQLLRTLLKELMGFNASSDVFAKIVETHRDGFTLHVLGLSLLREEKLPEALKAFQAAAVTPSFKDARFAANSFAMRTAWQILKWHHPTDEEKAELFNSLDVHVEFLLANPRTTPEQMFHAGQAAWQSGKAILLRRIANRWRELDESDCGPEIFLAYADNLEGRPLSQWEHANAARKGLQFDKLFQAEGIDPKLEVDALFKLARKAAQESKLGIDLPESPPVEASEQAANAE